jgi:16S rRNA (cytosine1402-N4)-methyltransferase
VALDRDDEAVAAAATIADARFAIVQAKFSDVAAVLEGLGIAAVDGVLLDIGVSSPQLDDAQRGFSFRFDAPLDMRMDRSKGQSAAEWLAVASEAEIGEVIRDYGEERFAKQVAKAIVAARAGGPVLTTRQLAAVVGTAVWSREAGQDPATRTFQALRIFINQELEELSLVLPRAMSVLAPGGRLAVISFHSLEDRIVKRWLRGEAHPETDVPSRLPIRAADLPQGRLRVIGKPVRAGEAEVRANPRARSAVMRIAEKSA